MSPSLLDALMMRSSSASGFCVGYPVRSFACELTGGMSVHTSGGTGRASREVALRRGVPGRREDDQVGFGKHFEPHKHTRLRAIAGIRLASIQAA